MTRVGEVCDRNVVCAPSDTTVVMAIKLMRQRHADAVIAVSSQRMGAIESAPLGIVTDSEIIAEIYATGLDPSVMTLGDFVVEDTPRLSQSDELSDAIYVMQTKGLDHLLVIDHEGRLAGTVSRKSLFNVMDENKSQGI